MRFLIRVATMGPEAVVRTADVHSASHEKSSNPSTFTCTASHRSPAARACTSPCSSRPTPLLLPARTPLAFAVVRTGSSELRAFGFVVGPAVIGRFDLQYSATFYASPSIPLGAAIEKVREAAAALPIGYQVSFIGEAEQLQKTSQATACQRRKSKTWSSFTWRASLASRAAAHSTSVLIGVATGSRPAGTASPGKPQPPG